MEAEAAVTHNPDAALRRMGHGIRAMDNRLVPLASEGQAARELEAPPYPFHILQTDNEPDRVDTALMIRAIVADLQAGRSKAEIAASFHATLIDLFAAMSSGMRKETGLTRVALSGGCFQNKILLEGSIERLSKDGFEVYSHSRVPCNDGGISLGQAVIAGAMIKKGIT